MDPLNHSKFLLQVEKRFKDPLYRHHTMEEFKCKSPVPPCYTFREVEGKSAPLNSTRTIKWMQPLNYIAEKCILPSSAKPSVRRSKEQSFLGYLPFIQKKFLPEKLIDHAEIPQGKQKDLGEGWKYKRFTLIVDGQQIDATVMAQPSTLKNGRWLLNSLGNMQRYEDKIKQSWRLKKILKQTQSNGILFNYPGVESSTGKPLAHTLVKAYQVLLKFLESKIKAKQIIGYGYSIGGGVQGEALRTHDFKPGIKYVFIKDRSFSCIQRVISEWTGLGSLVEPFGWTLNSIPGSHRLSSHGIPEIVMQSTCSKKKRLISDGVISAQSSHAKALGLEGTPELNHKHFIRLKETHRCKLSDTSIDKLAEIVNTSFDS